MLTYLYPHAITSIFPPNFLVKRILALVFALAKSFLLFANYTPLLSWKNPVLLSGKAGEDGAIYRFSQLDGNTDALVKITGRSNPLVQLENIDNTSSGSDKSWQPIVSYNKGLATGATDWWMEFEITFVNKGTYTPASVSNFDVTGCDIDGNGDKIQEYVSLFNLKSYSVDPNTLLTVSDVTQHIFGFVSYTGKRFKGPLTHFQNIDTSARSIMMTGKYQGLNKFCVRTGAVASGASVSAGRMYSLAFRAFNYTPQLDFSLPLVLTSFNAILDNKKVVLNWATGSEKQLSHFVIERSTNAYDYREIAIVFSGNSTTASSVIENYSFADVVNAYTTGILYYRLKMVDVIGRFQNSEVRLIRLSNSPSLQVQVCPNPVVNEVKLTIPAEWQNKRVSYELFNSLGIMIKRIISTSAAQTEVMNMTDCKTGIYVVKALMNDEAATQTIVKN